MMKSIEYGKKENLKKKKKQMNVERQSIYMDNMSFMEEILDQMEHLMDCYTERKKEILNTKLILQNYDKR